MKQNQIVKFSLSENRAYEAVPADAIDVTLEVASQIVSAQASGLSFVLDGSDKISVAPSHTSEYVDGKWIDYSLRYSQKTGQMYPVALLDAYSDLPSDLQKLTQSAGDAITQARNSGLQFVVIDADTVRVAKTQAEVWDAKKSTFVIDKAKQAELDEAARKAAIPQVVTMRQAKLALLQVGLLDEVDAVINSDNTPRALKIEWEFANEVKREWVDSMELGKLLNMTPAQLDDLFTLAATF